MLDVYRPVTAAAPRPVVLWGHGGGYVSGSRRQVADYDTVLADRGFVVASLEYSLAAQLVLLFCGLYDMATVGSTGFPALRTFLRSYTGERDWTRFPRIDELSTTRQVITAYPPVYLTVGHADPFQPRAKELESARRAHWVAVTSRYWPGAGLGHEYRFKLRTSSSRTVLADTVACLKRSRLIARQAESNRAVAETSPAAAFSRSVISFTISMNIPTNDCRPPNVRQDPR
ncbi:alpha/beta hydrolase [Actinoplanes sp. NPDC048796]|uniref:alpha/beta hydrolase n=1 Tax=Actinoplanes sp. NPDC048796 TaxID=3155640 RepID=UPI0033CF0EB8